MYLSVWLKKSNPKIYIKVVLGWRHSQVALTEENVDVLNPGLKEFSQINFQGQEHRMKNLKTHNQTSHSEQGKQQRRNKMTSPQQDQTLEACRYWNYRLQNIW